MLGSTVRVGSEVDETPNQNMSSNQTTTEPNQRENDRQLNLFIHLRMTPMSLSPLLNGEATSGSPNFLLNFYHSKAFAVCRGHYQVSEKNSIWCSTHRGRQQTYGKAILDMTNWLDTEIKVSPHRSLKCS